MSELQDITYNNKKDRGEYIKNEIRKYLKYWVWFLLGIIIALLGAYIYLRYTPKVYKSSAKIKILNKTKGLELPSSAFVFNRSNINLENEIEILKSYRIIENVVNELDLTWRFYEEGNVLTTEIDRLPFHVVKTISSDSIDRKLSYKIDVKSNALEISRLGNDDVLVFENFDTTQKEHNLPFDLSLPDGFNVSRIEGKTFLVKFASVKSVTGNLKGGVNISMLGKNSDLLQLNFTSQSRLKNERILNTLIDVFNQDGINDRQDVSRRTIDFIDERFLLLAQELDSIELGIKDYKQRNNLITVETDAELGISQRTLSEQELFNLENQLILSKLLNETLNKPNATIELLPANIGLNDPGINGLVANYNTLVFEMNNLIVSAGENNPKVKTLSAQLQSLKTNIFASINSYQNQLESSKSQLSRKNRKFASQVYSLPAKEKIIREITRQQAIKQSLYLFLLQKREEAAINLAITEPSIKVVEYAISGGVAISPSPRSAYAIALLMGLIIPLGFIHAIVLLNTKIMGKEDVTSRVGNIPILAELPKIKGNNLVFDSPTDRSVQAEAFRILSANVDYILPITDDSDGKVIYCTSTIKGEGKTYVAVNLSLALSSINKKVLLIGADLRNPQIHNYITQDKKIQGLSNYLHDATIDWKDILIEGFGKHPNHEILLSGDIPPNPTQLLTNGRFAKLLEEAKSQYDYVVIDTAPTILVTDTLLISKYADATIYLLRANHTEKNLLEFSKNLSQNGKIKNMAYVMNGVIQNKSYGYNYGYNYGYGIDN